MLRPFLIHTNTRGVLGLTKKKASYKQIRSPRVAVGKNEDAGFAIKVGVTDKRAASYQTYRHPKADQAVTITFLDHQERVTRRIWQQFIEQNAQRVTEPDVQIISVQAARHSASVYVGMAQTNAPQYQIIRIAAQLGPKGQSLPTIQTRFLAGAVEVGEWVRKIIAGYIFKPFTFEMYTWLRWWSQPQQRYHLEKHGKHWLAVAGEQNSGLSDEQARLAQQMHQTNLLVSRGHQIVVSDMGIALMNYFARFYEGQFSAQYNDVLTWQPDVLLEAANRDTMGQFKVGRNRQRHALQIPDRLPKKYRGDRWS